MAAAPLLRLGAAEPVAGTYAPRLLPVAEGIWMAPGAQAPIAFANGGAIANSVVVATDAGVLLIDPGPSLAYARALTRLAEQAAGARVAQVWITHLHPDHAMGAAAFDPAIVHALPATHNDLARDGNGFSDAMFRMLAGWMAGTTVVVPRGDLADGPLTLGGRVLRLFAMDGHSAGDLAVLDERTGTLIAGDLVFHDRAPATPHADLARWRASLDRLAAIPHKLVVPGHGPLDPADEGLRQTRDWLTWLETALRDAVAGGLDMTEAGALPIPDRFAGLAAARYELERSVSHFYPRFEAELLPRR